MATIDLRDVTTPEEAKRRIDEALKPLAEIKRAMEEVHASPGFQRRVREAYGRSAFPRFDRYSIPEPHDPKAVDCPYCVKRPRNLQAHCRAAHPDKPEARQ